MAMELHGCGCGGSPKHCYNVMFDEYRDHWIQCRACGNKTAQFESLNGAIDAWNSGFEEQYQMTIADCGCDNKPMLERHYALHGALSVVYCSSCGTKTKHFSKTEDAIIAWNKAMGHA